MTFEEIVNQAAAMLQRLGQVTYRSFQRQFDLDDDALEDLKDQLLFSHPVIHENGRGLVWTGGPATSTSDTQRSVDAEMRFQTLLRAVMWQLQCDTRITYRTLKHILGLDDTLLDEIRKELELRRLAIDENGEVMVWAGESLSAVQPAVTISSRPVTAVPDVTQTSIVPEAERRQLTVMFCDLADSTRLAQQLDPEDLREVIRGYQETAAEVIQHYEGHMAQYLGDSLLIYFGWPVAHEDDAQRALYAGLGIVQAITEALNPCLEQEKDVQLAVRIGIHTGPVVVGEMGGGGRHENLATGETVNIAARLEGLAAPNTVVISGMTERLVHSVFVLDDLGPQVMKGVAEPMPTFRVIGPVENEEDEPAIVGIPFLVGRDEEVGLLLRRWEQAKEGLGQVVLIS